MKEAGYVSLSSVTAGGVPIQSIALEGPSQDILVLARSGVENRELQTKMRTKDNRPRAHSTDPGYARPGSAGAKNTQKLDKAETEPLGGSVRRHATRRPNGGRFAKKAACPKAKKPPEDPKDSPEEGPPEA